MDGFIRPQNLQGYQNGNYTDDSFDFLSNVSNHDLNWDLNHLNNESIAQAASSHLNWPQSAGTSPGLETYGRQFSKSPSVTHAAATYGYGEPRQFTQSPYDPSLVQGPTIADPISAYVGHSPYNQQTVQHETIAPQALQNGQPQFPRLIGNLDGQGFSRNNNSSENVGNSNSLSVDYARPIPSAPTVDQAALFAAIPPGDISGLFSVVDSEKLASSSNTRKVNQFVNVSQQDFEYPINKATVPIPARRKSRNELRALAKNDPKLLAKLGKKHTKKTHSAAAPAKTQKPVYPTKQWQATPGIKYEGDSSSEEYSSSEDSSDYSEDELAEPSPLPAKRPDDPVEAVKYDTIKATWHSKRFEVDTEDIRTGLTAFWEIVRTIRDRWKTDTAAVGEATEKKKLGELPLLKSRVKDQRDMFQAALEAATQHGHRSIICLFGENRALLFAFSQYLSDRDAEKDYNGPLTRAILEMMALCNPISEANMTATKLNKICARFAKRSNNPEIRALVKRIETQVAESEKGKAGTPTPAPTQVDVKGVDAKPAKPSVVPRPVPGPVAGVKRAAPNVIVSDQPPKRVASGPAPHASTTATTATKPVPTVKRAVPGATAAKPSVVTQSAAARPKQALTKAGGGTSLTGAGVRKPAVVKSRPAAPSTIANVLNLIERKAVAPPAPQAPAFSFAATMKTLEEAPKVEEPAPKEKEEVQVQRPNETEEQKNKRIHKEKRRLLHVAFKEAPYLESIRYFHHDAAEELGHDESMIRDVADRGGEGRMFKQHKEMMDTDDDDEAGDENIRPYNLLTLTDFTVLDAEERKRNYKPYGGGELEPDSPERTVREQYEANTLMAYDNPPCPREPIEPYNGESIVTKEFGAPDAQSIAITRAAKFQSQPAAQQHQSAATSAPDISAILAMFNSQQPPPQQQQSPATTAPSAPSQTPEQFSEIQRILANLPPAASQQQPQMPSQAPQSAVVPDVASILANLQPQGNSSSLAAPIPQLNQPPATSGMVPDPANLAAILGQLNQGNGAMPPMLGNFPPQFGFQGSNFDGQNFGQHPQKQMPTYENEERKRWREGGDDDYGNQGRKWGKNKGKNTGKLYTLPCKYWKIGKCQKGSNCTYLHE